MRVPLFDLAQQHRPIREEIDRAIARVIDSGGFIGGSDLEQFEVNFAKYCNAQYAVGTSSGTSALTLILKALGIGPGDEVITTAMTFIATVESIVEAGATPVLVDCELETGLISLEATAAAITERTAAIVPVHLWGQMVDIKAFRELADKHRLALVEDAAQAHGAWFGDVRAGAMGDGASFSFYPGKNLGALGDAGAVTTSRSEIADHVRLLADHGRIDKYEHSVLGTNARLDGLQAAVLSVKLAYLDQWNTARSQHASAYDSSFFDVEGIRPIEVHPEAVSVYHQYVVRLGDRDAAMGQLDEAGISTGIHYPIAVSRQPAASRLCDPGEYPNADQLASTVLSIPVFPELTPQIREMVVEVLRTHAASSLSQV